MISPHTITKDPTDLVTLVNERDEVIGTMDKIEAHRGEAKLHRCVSVYLFQKNKTGVELLIQQRAAVKIVGANQWANTICGNVRPTEDYEQCAYRRLREELGITKVEIKPIYKFVYNLPCNEQFSEWEMDQVFFGWYDGEVIPNPNEAQDFSWVKWQELLEASEKTNADEQNFKTKKVELKNQIKTKHFTLTPWFVWMLGDKKLINLLNKDIY
ncbi:MAG: NUDIX domain-containing protein [Patescibacteria group bacterium]